MCVGDQWIPDAGLGAPAHVRAAAGSTGQCNSLVEDVSGVPSHPAQQRRAQ